MEFLQAKEVAYTTNEDTALLEMCKLFSMTRLSLERNKFGEPHRWIVKNHVCHVKESARLYVTAKVKAEPVRVSNLWSIQLRSILI